MILEVAEIIIKEGEQKAFEESLEKAQQVINKADGYLGHQFHHCMEDANKYMLLIKWTSLEAHTEGFRQSDLFVQWRALIGPYFASPPHVLHYQLKFE